jgi:putative spermidine/putrescine transport system permease protein
MRWLSAPASATQVTHASRLWLYVFCLAVMVFLVAPTLIVIPMSFSASTYLEFPPREWSVRWYEAYFSSIVWQQATLTSLKAAVLTTLLATPLGIAAAYGLHVSRFGFSTAIYAVLSLPLMVPIIMTAIGIFFLYAEAGLLNTIAGLVMAHSMLAVPLVVIVVASGLKSYDMNQEMVARSLGASRLWAFLTVTLPQIRFSVITGTLLAFLTSLDEVIVAMFISGGENATITRRMFNSLRDQIDPTITAISTCLIALSITLLVIAQMFSKKHDDE